MRYIAHDKLLSAGISGIVYAYDLATGKLAWTYYASDPYQEILWANEWWMRPIFISDGKLYLGHLEHSAIDPKPRGAPLVCLDIETGTEVWRANGLSRLTYWGGGPALIADSVIATMDTYDQRLYAIGKGPSATTVTAPNAGVPLGSSVLISGRVTDISPGTEDYSLRSRFPNGVAAVSDAFISEWMLYVYKQFPRPTEATGVEVTIDVIDANGNYRNIGTTTSDASGFFSLEWQPDISGKYTVIATFPGSKSYYASNDQTAFVIDQGLVSTATPTTIPEPLLSELYFVPAIVGIITAMVIGFAVTILMLRKRP